MSEQQWKNITRDRASLLINKCIQLLNNEKLQKEEVGKKLQFHQSINSHYNNNNDNNNDINNNNNDNESDNKNDTQNNNDDDGDVINISSKECIECNEEHDELTYCNECKGVFCARCLTSFHSFKLTKNHTFRSYDEICKVKQPTIQSPPPSNIPSDKHVNRDPQSKDGNQQIMKEESKEDSKFASILIDEWKWVELCRYVLPIIGFCIEKNVVTSNHITNLQEIGFVDSQGDIKSGMKLYHYACLYPNHALLVQILNHFPCSVNDRTNLISKSSAIHLAVNSITNANRFHPADRRCIVELTSHAISVITVLLKNGANINFPDGRGEPALYKAAMDGNYTLVVFLLNNRADPNVVVNNESSAIIVAARQVALVTSGPQHTAYNDCIKALLQFGSLYSSSLALSKTEKEIIQHQAKLLLRDTNSAYARYPQYFTSILSWVPREMQKK